MSSTDLDGVHVLSAHRRRLHAPANYLASEIYDGREAGDTAYKRLGSFAKKQPATVLRKTQKQSLAPWTMSAMGFGSNASP